MRLILQEFNLGRLHTAIASNATTVRASVEELASTMVSEVFRTEVQDDETAKLVKRAAAAGKKPARKATPPAEA